MKLLQKASRFIIGGLESIFYRWGIFVSRHPYPIIVLSIVFTLLSGMGFLNFRQEHQANLLWIPPSSDYNVNQEWLDNNYKNNRRDQMIIFQSDNVLTPQSIQRMFELHKRIAGITINGKTFEDICTKVPLGNIFHTDKRRRRRDTLATETLLNDQVVEEVPAEQDDAFYRELWPDYYDDEEEEVSKDDSNLWEDYDYGYDYDDDEVAVSANNDPRIDFEAFGKLEEEEGDEESAKKGLKELPPDIKCGIVTRLREKCVKGNLLEIWRYKEDLIYSTTQQEILDAINLLERNPWTSHKIDFISQLGGVVRNASGHVISANAARMYWNLKIPDNVELVTHQGSGVELELADQYTLDWEQEFIDIALNTSYPDVTILPNAAKSFSDISADAIFFDAVKMAAGYMIMFIYTILMLGKLNTLELKMYLSITGIVSVGMGLAIGIGLSSLLGYPYTPLHAALPFLCLGIGIDDMFVIVQCWFNMKRSEGNNLPLDESVGIALKHAGVSVTITTLTDVFAFGVGAVTRMPGLESFCVCTAIALGSIYILQITWFTAFLSLDEKRIESGRDGLIPCYVHKNPPSPSWEPSNLVTKFMQIYKKCLASHLFKGLVILFSLTCLGFGIWGSILIKQKFDPVLILPKDSYLRKWVDLNDKLFPAGGWSANVYSGPINHTNMENFERLEQGLQQLVDNQDHIRSFDSWWRELKNYARDFKNFTSWTDFTNEEDFPLLLSDFLFSTDGGRFRINFKFDGDLECGKPTPPIKASKFSVAFFIFDGPEEHIPAKQTLQALVSEAAISDTAFSHVKIYAAWETDEIIGTELWRNIGLAIMAVAIVTLILIANIQICLLVIVCVLLTLTDIVGFLHFWNMTIDIISCVSIVLAIGLCVDYSVHVAHAYLVSQGTRLEKSMNALQTIGPAVFNGGFTTFLALVLLGFSQSQIFLTFFKVFILTVSFGLFHGLVLLPVLLTIIGPLGTEEDSSAPVLGSSAVSPQSSAASSGQNSPTKFGHKNMAFIQECGLEVLSAENLDKPRLKSMFGKKGSWDVEVGS